MEIKRLNSECVSCLVNKYLKKIPENTEESQKLKYMQRVLNIVAEAKVWQSAPEIVPKITAAQKEIFGFSEDFTEIKKYFNSLMLGLESQLENNILNSKEPLKLAFLYAMLGNYIDFGAMLSVDENKLRELLKNAEELTVDDNEFGLLKEDLKKSKKLIYITDNCGEVVLDKLFIKAILKEYPNISVEAIVRGEDVLNDATLTDAKQVFLDKLVTVTGNGTNIAGTCLSKLPTDIKTKIDNADIIISKGQANFETLRYCGKNIYYIFMCKCQMFADRFGVPKLSGMLLNDLRMK
ncbi:MAG: ARMT1-like domain-containing protein [Acutalibacteraceae bacterium]|nr:ARMT1-like domain-containing protein [Acutalibacteraceae bacterium]